MRMTHCHYHSAVWGILISQIVITLLYFGPTIAS